MEKKTQEAFGNLFRGLIGWAMYTGFVVCIIKWPMRAVALAVFMVATNIHTLGKLLQGVRK